MLANFFPAQKNNSSVQNFYESVTPAGLAAYSIMANALFWCGLLLPYNANTASYIVYLRAFVVVMGVALAFGGATATLMIVSNKASVPYRSLEFASALLNFFVLTTTGTLVIHALILSLS